MTEETRRFSTDLGIIGSGIAGFSASIFALNRKIKTAQIGNTGAVAYTTGYLDLWGAADDAGVKTSDPWLALEKLQKSTPDHPFCRITAAEIRDGFNQVTRFLSENGIGYTPAGTNNFTALTPAGTTKQTLCMPSTMSAGPAALSDRPPCVIIGFKGVKGFSAKQVAANLKETWPELTTATITFPDMEHGELYPEVMARALEVPATRKRLAPLLKEAAKGAEYAGLPAILGMHNPDNVLKDLQELTGLTLFEIPTMPPSVPGIRLREMFEQVFPQHGLTLIPQQKVETLSFQDDHIILNLSDNYGPVIVEAKAVILATGRFLSGGLEARIDGIIEPLLDLPVVQPTGRQFWYNESYTGKSGHPINRTGIEVDHLFRPLNRDGQPFHPALFGAGSILAHQDWIRSRSGAGIAISTAYKAVEAAEKYITA